MRKHPVVDHDMPSPLRIPVGAEESRRDSASTHALSSIPNSPKQWIMPMLDVDFPVISPVSVCALLLLLRELALIAYEFISRKASKTRPQTVISI